MVRDANAKILSSRIRQLAKATRDGRPGGCWKARAGSAGVQYSSSHSVIGSRSKLKELVGDGSREVLRLIRTLHHGSRTAAPSRSCRACPSRPKPWTCSSVCVWRLERRNVPEGTSPELIFDGRSGAVGLLAMDAGVLCHTYPHPDHRPCAIWGVRAVEVSHRQLHMKSTT